MPESDKRNDILNAASHCFAHFGYSKTTMDDIGRMVGLNKASLYYYYKNKEAIFCEIIETEGKRFRAGLKEKISHMVGWDQKIQTYLSERLLYFHKTANLNTLSTQATKQLQFQSMFKTLAAKFSEREAGLLKDILDQALADKQIRDIDTGKTAQIILSIANSLKHEQKKIQGTGLPTKQINFERIEEDTRFAVDLIIDGLRANC